MYLCKYIKYVHSIWFYVNTHTHIYICMYTYMYVNLQLNTCMSVSDLIERIFTCFCLRTENRSRKTHVFEYRDCGVGWGGMLTFLVLRTWNIATLLTSLGSFTTLYVATLLMGWGGVGWGGMLSSLYFVHEILPRCWHLWDRLLRYMLLRCWWGGVGGVGGHVNVPCTSYMIYCHAAEISGIVYYVTCCYAAAGVGWGGGGMLTFLVLRAWNIATLLRSPGSFTTLHVATLLKVESDEKVNSQQLECQKWPLDGVC